MYHNGDNTNLMENNQVSKAIFILRTPDSTLNNINGIITRLINAQYHLEEFVDKYSRMKVEIEIQDVFKIITETIQEIIDDQIPPSEKIVLLKTQLEKSENNFLQFFEELGFEYDKKSETVSVIRPGILGWLEKFFFGLSNYF
ncbi:uncharacterized protein LOC126909831 [Daktulosphaira vitifoliae]|nr:uncharacterized protein LOC126909831 [Daktulosphaira vitifoliae]